MLLLDLSKAFDTVSQGAILRAAIKAKIPPPLIGYLKHQYETARVMIGNTEARVNSGVRQGDPLSPLLFILVMDEVIRAANPNIGVRLGEVCVDSIAYADDLVLLANDKWELQEKLDGLQKGLEMVGLSLNPAKSVSITMLKDGKRKRLALSPETYQTQKGEIRPLKVTDQVKYLGLRFSWKGMVKPKHTQVLDRALKEIKEAPLKPYQRLIILHDFAVPKLHHELVLGVAHRNTLRAMDRMIRAAVRSWLRLPKDTPLGFLHAPIPAGGLNIPSLLTSVPLMQKKRIEKLLSKEDDISRALTSKTHFKSVLRATNIPVRVGPDSISSTAEGKRSWTNLLHSSVDGRELDYPDVDPGSHRWLTHPERVFPRLHLRGIQLRGGVLASKTRKARGRTNGEEDLSCRGACGDNETLNHILKICPTTHNVRCERHNRVVKLLEKKLRRKAINTWTEPIIKTTSTFIKPDLIMETQKEMVIMDVTVVAGGRMEESWTLKERKYNSGPNKEAIEAWNKDQIPTKHIPIVISSRGLLYGPSGRGLRALGLTSRDIMDLCVLTISGSLKCYDLYMNKTS